MWTDIGSECIRGLQELIFVYCTQCLHVRMTDCVCMCVDPYRSEWKDERVRSGASAEVNMCRLEDEALLTGT